MASVYMVVPLGGDDLNAFRTSIQELGSHTAIYDDYAPRAWFVSFDGTAKQLSDKLGFTIREGNEKPITGVVTGIDGYYGFGSKDLWVWLKNQTA